MADTHRAESAEMVDTIIKNLKPYHAKCECFGYGEKTHLPKFKVTQTEKGFEIKTWYVCSECGREK